MTPEVRSGGDARSTAGAALDLHLADLDLTLTALGGARVASRAAPVRSWIPGRRTLRLVHRATFEDGAAREARTLVVFGRAGWTIDGRPYAYDDAPTAFDGLTRSLVERLFTGRMESLAGAFR